MKLTAGALLCFLGAAASASTIGSVSTDGGAGQQYQISPYDFNVTGDEMAGLNVKVNFVGGSSSCVFAIGNPNAGCSTGVFSLFFPHLQDTDPDTSGANGIWTLTNLSSSNTFLSLELDGIAGGIIFDRCLRQIGGNPQFFDDDDNGTSLCDGAHNGLEGTPGTAQGWSANDGNGGTAGITATALYANALYTGANAPIFDAWGKLTLTFGGTAFTSGSNFVFRADTDLVTISSNVPEPTSFILLGLGLVGIGYAKKRKAR